MNEFSPPAMHQQFRHEIAGLLRAVQAGHVVCDRVLTEQVVQMLDALADITEMHDVDELGRCRECQTGGGMLRARRAPCLVHDALSLHTRGHRRHNWGKHAPRPP